MYWGKFTFEQRSKYSLGQVENLINVPNMKYVRSVHCKSSISMVSNKESDIYPIKCIFPLFNGILKQVNDVEGNIRGINLNRFINLSLQLKVLFSISGESILLWVSYLC